MVVVLEQSCYAGDECEQDGRYYVSNVWGPFSNDAAAKAFIATREKGYGIDYEIMPLKSV